MARLLFFAFAAAFCLAACFPVKSSYSDSGWAELTFAIAYQDYPSGIYYDRQFDWPTGEAIWVDVPVWMVDTVLFLLASVAFGFHVRNKLQHQKNL